MTRKITFALLALVLAMLPAAAQNQGLTSFNDNQGDHIYTQHGFGSPNNNDIFQVDPTLPWAGDMNQLSCSGGNPPPNTNGFSPSPVASFTDSAGQHLLYVDNKMHVRDLEYSSSCANLDLIALADLQPPLNSVPVSDGKSVAAYSDGQLEHAYYTGADGHVHHLFYVAGFVTHEDLTVKAGLTPSSPCGVISSALTAFSDSRSSPIIELVYYVGSTNHLCELALWQKSWGSYDLTAMCGSGCGAPIQRSPLTGFTDASGQHVFYLDARGHVFEFSVSSSLSNLDLTTRFGSTPAVADALTSISNAFGPQVIYVDKSQHVNQINLKTGVQDVTKLSGAALTLHAMSSCPNAANVASPGTSLSSIGSDDKRGEDVFYIGADTHIWEIHSDGRTWSSFDLTQDYGGTTSFGTIACIG